MKSLPCALALFAVAGLLVIQPAEAESFTVVLANGTVIESRYPPRSASDDADKLLLLTEWGNWIALRRADVREVRAASTDTGFEREMDTRARFVGVAPNDAPRPVSDAEDGEELSMVSLVADYLLERNLAAIEERLRLAAANTVRQFAEPPVAGQDPGTGLLLGYGPATEMDEDLLRLQDLTPELVLQLQGLTEASTVPLEGLAAAPPSLFWGSPPGDTTVP